MTAHAVSGPSFWQTVEIEESPSARRSHHRSIATVTVRDERRVRVTVVEHPVLFDCEGDQLVGLLSLPEPALDVGVVVVVGGPQYRPGSHRQFVYLSRSLANEGIACLRFDYRGMGDSEGRPRSFESIDADIACAVKELMNRVPCVRQVVLCGLCDGASAALIALVSLSKVAGVIALNPWVRSETSLDQALVKHYYAQRVLSREFWVKVLTGKLGIVRAVSEFSRRVSAAFTDTLRSTALKPKSTGRLISYQDRMCDGLMKVQVPALIVLSGRDLTAPRIHGIRGISPALEAGSL